jgi:YidC/Oxa1 family membrane protein insertase
MERNHLLGFLLIFAILFVWTYTSKPSPEELEQRQRERDSIELLNVPGPLPDEELVSDYLETVPREDVVESIVNSNDSLKLERLKLSFGSFAPSAFGEKQLVTLENDLIELVFDSKGGFLHKATIKDHVKTVFDNEGNRGTETIVLLNDDENQFEYLLPLNQSGLTISTADLYFKPEIQGNTLTFTAISSNGGHFVQKYTLNENDYTLQYDIAFENLNQVIGDGPIKLKWKNYLHKLEVADTYEQRNSTIYFKESKKDKSDYCSCASDAKEDKRDSKIDWISNSNQFFNTSIIAKTAPFSSGFFETQLSDLEKTDRLKSTFAELILPINNYGGSNFQMEMYVGPNEFERLLKYNNHLEEIIVFGSSLFGTINRWVVRPAFNFLTNFISSKGIAIIVMIFIIKMLLYPLLYKMLYSQAKMEVLKPEIAHLKTKHKDDMQKQQVETMKIYSEYGVSPLSGCLPMVLQMPIWIALYRFFPASIDFRQESFLWSQDLSSYDAFFNLPFTIPFMGSHLSLFTMLWAVSTVLYTHYSSRHMDMTANPAMKYVQYFMPIMFLGFFNSFASGLTCYMFFSNIINVGQTIITKNFVFDKEKIREGLEIKKSNPKKKSKFQQKLEDAMKEQQRIQAEKAKKKK